MFEKLDLSLHDGWCGVVGANGSGKSTLLSLIAGLIEPDSGQIHAPPALLCKQELGDVTQIREDALTRWDQRAMMLRELLQLDDAQLWRWEQLSSGEQKRWQIGHALMMHPAVILLDEPTNHLDIDAKNLLIEALQTFEGTGILISHDRHLLDAVTSRTLWLDDQDRPPTLYPAPYSEAARLRHTQREAYLHERAARKARHEHISSSHTDASQRHLAANANISARARMSSRHDHDARSAAAKHRVRSAEKSLAKRSAALESAERHAAEKLSEMPYEPVYAPHLKVTAHCDAPGSIITHLAWPDGLYAPGKKDDGRLLLEPGALTLKRGERLWLKGPNGAGKSTLLRALLDTVSEAHLEHILWLPQRLDDEEQGALKLAFEKASRETRGRWLEIAASFGVEVNTLLGVGVERLSPGSLRKFALARGLVSGTWAMILDEPTNHLDLPSIQALEGALVDYEGALLIVTHDVRFGERLNARMLCIDPESRALTHDG